MEKKSQFKLITSFFLSICECGIRNNYALCILNSAFTTLQVLR